MRFGFELKYLRSQIRADVLIENGWDVAIGSLRGSIEFLDPEDHDINKGRRKPADWWTKLIASSRHVIKLGQRAVESIEKLSNWVHSQLPASLTVLTEASMGDISWIIDMIVKGSSKMKKHHRLMVMQAKRIGYVHNAQDHVAV